MAAPSLTPPYVLNKDLLDVLRQAMDLPERIFALKLTLEFDRIPVVECSFHPVKDMVEPEELITNRFGLHELKS